MTEPKDERNLPIEPSASQGAHTDDLPVRTKSSISGLSLGLDDRTRDVGSPGDEAAGSSGFAAKARSDQRYQPIRELRSDRGYKSHLVHDQDLKRPVILKWVSTNDPMLPRFLEETQIMGQLGHPHIAEIHEIGHMEGRLFYWTVPYIPGRSLRESLDAGHKEGEEDGDAHSLIRRVRILYQIALALSYAHEKGVLHRNVSPKNIWLGEHGEVLLTGWSTAKVIKKGEVQTDRDTTLTTMQEVIGDPLYIAPEQAATGDIGPWSDLYSLGVILYEVLAMRLPFEGSAVEVLGKKLYEEPPPPSQFAAGRKVPIELERSCMRALSKNREDRQDSAGEMAEELRTWLDVASDKLKRLDKAEAMVRRAKALLEGRNHRKAEGAPFGQGSIDLAQEGQDLVSALTAALGAVPDHEAARQMLSDYHWDCLQRAAQRRDASAVLFHGAWVRRYGEGRYGERLERGSLSLSAEPAGAKARLEAHVPDLDLGPLPWEGVCLPAGHHVLICEAPGYHSLRCPFLLLPAESKSLTLALTPESDIGSGFVHIPAGSYLAGPDGLAREVWLDDFFILRFPVTFEDYLSFLKEVAAWDVVEAASRAPRDGSGRPLLKAVGAGRFALPEPGGPMGTWDKTWPLYGISCEDAETYCAWRSSKDGLLYALPSSEEWEKASRGVDGRRYPWGPLFQPGACHVPSSGGSPVGPVPVDALPQDESVYGVRGMAGNVREWTGTRSPEEEGDRAAVAGSSWKGDIASCQCSHRTWAAWDGVGEDVGFRLVWNPKQPHPEPGPAKARGFRRFFERRGRP